MSPKLGGWEAEKQVDYVLPEKRTKAVTVAVDPFSREQSPAHAVMHEEVVMLPLDLSGLSAAPEMLPADLTA